MTMWKEFFECCHLTRWDDQVLKNCFVGGMDDNISQLLLVGDSRVILEQFLDSVLWLCGSAYIVREVDNNDSATQLQSLQSNHDVLDHVHQAHKELMSVIMELKLSEKVCCTSVPVGVLVELDEE